MGTIYIKKDQTISFQIHTKPPESFKCFSESTLTFSKKWKKLLTFPHISECLDLQHTLKGDTYEYIVGNQPIGNKLFRQFCFANKKYYTHFNDFLDDVDNYETELEENRVVEAQKIFTKYLSKPQGMFSYQKFSAEDGNSSILSQ